MTALRPGYSSTRHNYFAVNNQQRWTHLRLNLYPDGGIARLRVYGTAVKDWTHVALQKLPVDLTAMVNGGTAEGWSNIHYGHPRNLIAPGTAANMGDGWETARRMDRPSILEQGKDGCLNLPGCEWSVIQLGHPGTVQKIEIDTNLFKGNFPESCKMEGFLMRKKSQNDVNTKDWSSCSWKTILPRTKTTGNCLGEQTFRQKIESYGSFRDGTVWACDVCLGNCSVQYGGQFQTTDGFCRATCSGSLQNQTQVGFWCNWDDSGGAVLMIGRGGHDCQQTDHAIAITEAEKASFLEK
ncbi:probable allantoicase [Acropora millepora]|uniref:probable allantoicase n=1 Tax=Acropora millepora TaxID=45264 RepID=UPI001CF4DC1E|nr:probable allantoicase [Acropora millepora]